jgi:hypothetical protein
MIYHITTVDYTTHILDLPLEETDSIQAFEQHPDVVALGQSVLDITPDGMPDRFTDEEMMTILLRHQGIRRGAFKSNGLAEYISVEE